MKVSFSIPFDCPDRMTPHLEKVFSGEYDVPLEYAKAQIIDLGANFGAFSVWASHRWPGAQIFAYEPHPETFRGLLRNTTLYSGVTCFPVAVGALGVRVLYDGRFNEGEASLFEITKNPNPTGRHVEVVSPLSLPAAHIIKLDIEGAEMEVLRPLIEAGRRFNAILLEWHSHDLRREVDSLLADYKLIKSEVYHPIGRGLSCYIHKEFS